MILAICELIHILILMLLINRQHWRSSHYAVTHVREKNSNTQGRSPNFPLLKKKETAHKGTNSLPLGANSFLFREVPILKKDAIEENHSLIQ